MEYGKKTENHGKWEINTLGSEIWRGKLRKVENLEMHTVGPGKWRENWKSRKCEIHTLGYEIWLGKLKKVANLVMSSVGHRIWQKTENYE